MDEKPLALVIEDHDDQLLVFTTALEQAGYKTEPIKDGLTAQKRLKEVVPDIIVLDLHLPHVNGKELLTQIKHNPRLSEIPIILATADAALAERLQSQTTLVLLKPISFSQLSMMASRYPQHKNSLN